MTLVDIDNLHKSYTTGGEITNVLKGTDLQMKKGEMVMVMGPSGSGKTTLLNLLGGIDGSDSGVLKVDGMDLTGLGKKELNRFRRERIGFIFQFYNLIPTLTALENVELGLENLVGNSREMKERARKYLEMVGLSDKARNYPQELSGGQQQRVAIARALAKEPALVLADEPTGNLDEEREQSIMRIMKDLQHGLGITFLIVSHNTRLKKYMDRTLILRHGKLNEGS
ncbi:MAG: ABC transporter ATP-binding protein [Candidatus Thermoplasmatota archaeon]|nr:ABC transporter ATP-binding protein [Candidatus Thermoplasmatota archaeon]